MKINGYQRIGALNPYRKSTGDMASVSEVGSRGKDRLSISEEAKALLEIGRSERVEQLKKAVENGVYHVDALKIAEKMLPYFRATAGEDR